MAWLTPGEAFPFASHRHMGEVLADEAIARRRRARFLANERARQARFRARCQTGKDRLP